MYKQQRKWCFLPLIPFSMQKTFSGWIFEVNPKILWIPCESIIHFFLYMLRIFTTPISRMMRMKITHVFILCVFRFSKEICLFTKKIKKFAFKFCLDRRHQKLCLFWALERCFQETSSSVFLYFFYFSVNSQYPWGTWWCWSKVNDPLCFCVVSGWMRLFV